MGRWKQAGWSLDPSQGQGRSASWFHHRVETWAQHPTQSPKGGAPRFWEDRGHPLNTQQHPPSQRALCGQAGLRSAVPPPSRPPARGPPTEFKAELQTRPQTGWRLPGRSSRFCFSVPSAGQPHPHWGSAVCLHTGRPRGVTDESGSHQLSPHGTPRLPHCDSASHSPG